MTSFLLNLLFIIDNITFKWEFGGDKIYVVVIQNDEIISKDKMNKIENEFGESYFITTMVRSYNN